MPTRKLSNVINCHKISLRCRRPPCVFFLLSLYFYFTFLLLTVVKLPKLCPQSNACSVTWWDFTRVGRQKQAAARRQSQSQPMSHRRRNSAHCCWSCAPVGSLKACCPLLGRGSPLGHVTDFHHSTSVLQSEPNVAPLSCSKCDHVTVWLGTIGKVDKIIKTIIKKIHFSQSK